MRIAVWTQSRFWFKKEKSRNWQKVWVCHGYFHYHYMTSANCFISNMLFSFLYTFFVLFTWNQSWLHYFSFAYFFFLELWLIFFHRYLKLCKISLNIIFSGCLNMVDNPSLQPFSEDITVWAPYSLALV